LAADNDAFKAWDQARYLRMINKIVSTLDRSRFLWVTIPDVVGDAKATVDRWNEWYPRIRDVGLPAAFVGQDGLGDISDLIPWDDMASFFVGGSDEWKLSVESERFLVEAKSRGKWTHIGRVNSFCRIRHAVEIGADSIDGRSFSAWPDRRIPEGLNWIKRSEQQRHFLEIR
jgi:hypothetical protein